jgi:hypothetical protein
MGAALAASLFATICIDGTLHGLPQTLCREFQVRGFPTVEACERGRKAAVDDWFAGIAFLAPHLVAVRCGPAEPEGDDI